MAYEIMKNCLNHMRGDEHGYLVNGSENGVYRLGTSSTHPTASDNPDYLLLNWHILIYSSVKAKVAMKGIRKIPMAGAYPLIVLAVTCLFMVSFYLVLTNLFGWMRPWGFTLMKLNALLATVSVWFGTLTLIKNKISKTSCKSFAVWYICNIIVWIFAINVNESS